MTSSATIKPAYVTDTNALYWYLTGDKRLSPHARSIYQAAEDGQTQIIISAIVLAELCYILQKKPLPKTYAELHADLKSKPFYQFVAFEPDDVLNFSDNTAIPEMHDRMIAGLARRLGIPLITVDPIITASKLVSIEWETQQT